MEDRAVAAGGQDHGVGGERLDLARLQVAGHDAPGAAVDDDQLLHLVPGVHRHAAEADLPLQRLVGPQQELLAGLAPGIEGARDLGAAERPVRQRPAVLACERDSLRHALVDDVDRDLGEAVDVRLAGAEVAPFDRVVEQAEHAVAVVLVVLRGVDPALSGDRVRPPRAVLVAEARDPVAELGERRRGRGAREARAHDDHGVLPFVRRVDQLHVELVPRPLLLERAGRDVRFQFHGA